MLIGDEETKHYHEPVALWLRVQQYVRMIPLCYMSEADAHREAAKEVATQTGLSGWDLENWNRYVEQKTRNMSRYSGD